MRAIFKLIFTCLTDKFALPVDPISNYILLGIIGIFAFQLAFSQVGDLYRANIIDGGLSGSFCHWTFRLIDFAILWAGANISIKIYEFMKLYGGAVLMIAGGIVAASILSVVSIAIIRLVRNILGGLIYE